MAAKQNAISKVTISSLSLVGVSGDVTRADEIRHLLLRMGEKQSQFEELLLAHLDGAYNLAFWLTENDEDARAIVEAAYVEARREFEKLGATDTRVWLFKIILRIAHTWAQRQDHGSGSFSNDLSGKSEGD